MKQEKKLAAENIIKALEGHKAEIRKYSVKKIGLFGSFLKGNPGKESDIDFIVEFDELTFDNYMDMKFFLEKLFQRKVDLVVVGALKPAMRYVAKEAVYAEVA